MNAARPEVGRHKYHPGPLHLPEPPDRRACSARGMEALVGAFARLSLLAVGCPDPIVELHADWVIVAAHGAACRRR